MKARFIRKAASYREIKPMDTFVIEGTVYLEPEEFYHFKNNLLEDYDFIRANCRKMYRDTNGVWHCILVTTEEADHGILVEAEGYSYARYSAYINKSNLEVK